MSALLTYGAELALFDKLDEDLAYALNIACRDLDEPSRRAVSRAITDMRQAAALAEHREIRVRANTAVVAAKERFEKATGATCEPLAWVPD